MADSVFNDVQVILVPGLHNSSPDHWQSLWHASHPQFYRVEQDDWDNPDLDAWAGRIDEVRARDARPALLLAHSFGCLAAAVSIARAPGGVAGAFLAAPADPDRFGVAARLPHAALGVPATVIGSRDDPWMAFDGAAAWAARWGATLFDAGAVGHINAASGLGAWPAGWEALELLLARTHAGPAAMPA